MNTFAITDHELLIPATAAASAAAGFSYASDEVPRARKLLAKLSILLLRKNAFLVLPVRLTWGLGLLYFDSQSHTKWDVEAFYRFCIC